MPTGIYPIKKRKGLFQKGHTAWNKGQKGLQIHSIRTRKKISFTHQGKKHSKETKIKMSENSYMKRKIGKDSPNWKGGCIKNQRNDPAYHQWVKAVKKRDNNTCWLSDENCKGYNIIHHIFNWKKYPKLRYEVKNGITLCQAHHPRERVKEKLFKRLFSYLLIQK